MAEGRHRAQRGSCVCVLKLDEERGRERESIPVSMQHTKSSQFAEAYTLQAPNNTRTARYLLLVCMAKGGGGGGGEGGQKIKNVEIALKSC